MCKLKTQIICKTCKVRLHVKFFDPYPTFEIRLSTQQLPKILPKGICIFSNVHQQIISKVKLSQ